jgi:hypothetical protein
MQTLYYCFEKGTGLFAGAGTPYCNTETHGCTTTPTPEYNIDTQTCVWNGTEWSVIELPQQ